MDNEVISKLLEHDAQFGDFLETLYGVSKMGDASEVHVPSDGSGQGKKKALAGGLLLGSAAEGLATTRAVQTAARSVHTKVPGAKLKPVVPPSRLNVLGHSRTGKVAEAALQVANLGVGLASAHELVSSGKKKKVSKAFDPNTGNELDPGVTPSPTPPGQKPAYDPNTGQKLSGGGQRKPGRLMPVSKGVVGHFQPAGLIRANSRMRKAGLRQITSTPRRAVAKAMFTKVGEEFVAGRRPIQALKMGGEHRPGGAPGGARHRAEMPKKKLTTTGKVSLASGGALTAAGGVALAARPKNPPTSIAKSVTWVGEIAKFDEDKRQVFGWLSVSEVDGEPVVDRQGDYIPIDESETAAYTYVLHSRKGGDQHRRISKADAGPVHTADLIESMVFTPEKIAALGLEPDALPLGWWGGFQINDEQQWEDVKADKRLGFSVHGSGARREVVLA